MTLVTQSRLWEGDISATPETITWTPWAAASEERFYAYGFDGTNLRVSLWQASETAGVAPVKLSEATSTSTNAYPRALRNGSVFKAALLVNNGGGYYGIVDVQMVGTTVTLTENTTTVPTTGYIQATRLNNSGDIVINNQNGYDITVTTVTGSTGATAHEWAWTSDDWHSGVLVAAPADDRFIWYNSSPDLPYIDINPSTAYLGVDSYEGTYDFSALTAAITAGLTVDHAEVNPTFEVRVTGTDNCVGDSMTGTPSWGSPETHGPIPSSAGGFGVGGAFDFFSPIYTTFGAGLPTSGTGTIDWSLGTGHDWSLYYYAEGLMRVYLDNSAAGGGRLELRTGDGTLLDTMPFVPPDKAGYGSTEFWLSVGDNRTAYVWGDGTTG